jgi:hypothetical protein
MNYNVTEDRREWARVKVDLMQPSDRIFLMEELIKRDDRHASSFIGDLGARQHGLRRKARERVAYP